MQLDAHGHMPVHRGSRRTLAQLDSLHLAKQCHGDDERQPVAAERGGAAPPALPVWVRCEMGNPSTTPSKNVPSWKIGASRQQLFTNVHEYSLRRSPLLTHTLATVQYPFGQER